MARSTRSPTTPAPTPATTRLAVLLAFSLAVALTACGGGGATRSTPVEPESTASTSSAEPEPPQGDAQDTFRAARLALLEANTGFYRVGATVGPMSITTQGEYDLARRAATARLSLTQSDARVVVDSVIIGRRGYLRFVEGLDLERPSCWLALDDITRLAVDQRLPQAELLAGGFSGVLYPLDVVVRASVDRWDGDRLLGRSSLLAITGSVSSRLPFALGLTDDEARGRVAFELADGRLTGWRARLGDMLQDARRAGLALPEELAGFEAHRDELGGISVQLSQPGRDLTVELPDASRVVEMVTDDAELERRLASCPEE